MQREKNKICLQYRKHALKYTQWYDAIGGKKEKESILERQEFDSPLRASCS
jgi:hypothetical protein